MTTETPTSRATDKKESLLFWATWSAYELRTRIIVRVLAHRLKIPVEFVDNVVFALTPENPVERWRSPYKLTQELYEVFPPADVNAALDEALEAASFCFEEMEALMDQPA